MMMLSPPASPLASRTSGQMGGDFALAMSMSMSPLRMERSEEVEEPATYNDRILEKVMIDKNPMKKGRKITVRRKRQILWQLTR
jgi:hypothetical protein